MNNPINSSEPDYQYNSSSLRERRKTKRRRSPRNVESKNRKDKGILLPVLLILILIASLLAIFAGKWSTVWANHVFYLPGSAYALATANPQGTPTATPFQPIIATTAPQVTVPEENAIVSNIEGTGQEKIVKQSGQVYILLLGSDQRQGDNGFRTDEIILLCINRLTFQVSIVSFPRDLYVDIPGEEAQRINTAMGKGGFELLVDTIDMNFGIRPDFYFMTNFWSFIEVVDSLGGLEIYVPEYLEDQCEPPKTGTCFVEAGDHIMDGETALWYVRSRRTTSDFERTKRGREVLKALFMQLMSVDAVTHFSELYETYNEYVETNMGLNDMLTILPVATVLVKDPDRIQFYSIGPEETSDYYTAAGAQVLLPDSAAIHNILLDALSK